MKLKYIFISTVLLASLSACEDMFEPSQENIRGVEEMFSDPNYASGLLGYGYAMLPYDNSSVSDVATDDAVLGHQATILWNSGRLVRLLYSISILS